MEDGTPGEVRQLIEAGADVKALDKNTATPLFMAAYFNADIEVFKLLIDAGSDVNAQVGHVVAMIIDGGRDAEPRRLEGGGPSVLMAAAGFHHNPEVIRLLVGEGAEVHIRSEEDAFVDGGGFQSNAWSD